MPLPHVTIHLVHAGDEPGFALTDRYVSDFYTAVLGPTSISLLGWVGRHVDDSVNIDLSDLAARLGVSTSVARNAPMMRTINRLGQFGIVAWNPAPAVDVNGRLLVLSRLPPVPARFSQRWPPALVAEHDAVLLHGRGSTQVA